MPSLELLLIPLGFAVGAYGAFVGAGGGFLLVPALLLIYPDQPPAQLTAMSLAVVLMSALSGSIAHARLRRIDYLTGVVFAAATLPGAVIGSIVIDFVPRQPFDLMFGVLLIILAGYTWWSVRHVLLVRAVRGGRGVITRTLPGEQEGESFRYSFSLPLGIACSLALGFVSSLLGIGGGILYVPLMIAGLHFPVHVAVATSQFVLMFTAGAGTLTHVVSGTLRQSDLVRIGLLSAGVIPGAYAGVRLSERFRGPIIVYTLIIALVLVGARLLADGLE